MSKPLYPTFAFLTTCLLALFTNSVTAKELNDLCQQILAADAKLFDAFNQKDQSVLQTMFTRDLEFYHDTAGLSNYEENMNSFLQLAKNVPDLHRTLNKESVAVYPVKDFGAIQTGEHTFCHERQGKMDCGTFKFAHVWKLTGQGWKVHRVLSFDH